MEISEESLLPSQNGDILKKGMEWQWDNIFIRTDVLNWEHEP